MQVKIFSPSNDYGVGMVYGLFSSYISEHEDKYLKIQAPTARGFVDYNVKKPLSISAFIVYCFEVGGINVSKLFKSGASVDDEYLPLIEYIRAYFSAHQVENALVGNYNAGLVQRLNNIRETIEVVQLEETPILNIDFSNVEHFLNKSE